MEESTLDNATPLDRADLKEQFDYATKQFFFIADQRIKTFHFYVIVASAATAATFQLTKEFDRLGYLSLCAAHVVIVAVFLVIEKRNLRLLTTCKGAILYLESVSGWHEDVCMATRDARESTVAYSTYRNAIRIAFAGQILVAVMLFLYAVGLIQTATNQPITQSNLKAVKNTTSATKTGSSSGGMAQKGMTPTPASQPKPGP